MGFWILQPRGDVHVAGTVLLYGAGTQSEAQTSNLKHDSGNNQEIILVPQPSEDPNDPLNWSSFEKNTILAILCYGSITGAAVLVCVLHTV